MSATTQDLFKRMVRRDNLPTVFLMLRHDSCERAVHFCKPWGRRIHKNAIANLACSKMAMLEGTEHNTNFPVSNPTSISWMIAMLIQDRDQITELTLSRTIRLLETIASYRNKEAAVSQPKKFRQPELRWHVERYLWLKKQWEFAGERALFLVYEGHLVPPDDLAITSPAALQLDMFGGRS